MSALKRVTFAKQWQALLISSWFVAKNKLPRLPTTNQPGFTLIELMVAISIVAILSTIGMVMYSSAQGTARDAKRKGDLEDIKKALYLYQVSTGTFCVTGKGTCAAGNGSTYVINDAPLPTVLGPYFKGSTVPRDPKYSATRTSDYFLQLIGDDKFILSATLEGVAPSVAEMKCTPPKITWGGPWLENFCITE